MLFPAKLDSIPYLFRTSSSARWTMYGTESEGRYAIQEITGIFPYIEQQDKLFKDTIYASDENFSAVSILKPGDSTDIIRKLNVPFQILEARYLLYLNFSHSCFNRPIDLTKKGCEQLKQDWKNMTGPFAITSTKPPKLEP